MTNFPLRRTDFHYKYCDAEMAYHYQWRLNNKDKYPLAVVRPEDLGVCAILCDITVYKS